MATADVSQPPSPPAANNGARRKALTAVAAAVLLLGAAWGGYTFFIARGHESTDNAYVQANVVQITPQVAGTVLEVRADDTNAVKAGEALVRLDPADARVAVEQAEAQLAQTVREVRTLYTNNGTLAAQVAMREADLARVRADLAKTDDDLRRRAPLVASGAVGKEEFDHANAQLAAARSALAAAQSGLRAAQEQLASNRSLTDGTDVQQHPNVQRAAAHVREAYLALARIELAAPVDGVVARRSVQVGQRVQAGAPLMSLVAMDHLWVDANFRESQLAKVRIGQPATLEADVYGTKVQYHGTVAGLGAGTGAAFALLPAQNATGNWIKVVQRVPVRIALDTAELAQHPLRVGLSMQVDIDVRDTSGKLLAERAPEPPHAPAEGASAHNDDDIASRAISRIVAANLGHASSAGEHRSAVAPVQAGGRGSMASGAHSALR
jgi:membrane fusion protein, multidrug efflux system